MRRPPPPLLQLIQILEEEELGAYDGWLISIGILGDLQIEDQCVVRFLENEPSNPEAWWGLNCPKRAPLRDPWSSPGLPAGCPEPQGSLRMSGLLAGRDPGPQPILHPERLGFISLKWFASNCFLLVGKWQNSSQEQRAFCLGEPEGGA